MALTEVGRRLLIKPPAPRTAVADGFTLDDFRIDTSTSTVTCPAGHTTALLSPGGKHHQRKACFTARQCASCPAQVRVHHRQGGRVVTWRLHHQLQEAARQQAADPTWQADHRRWRPAVNGPSPGSSTEAIAACSAAASSKANAGSITGPLPSTSAD
ncbi:transposase [Streptomyces albireticuli]|uniref:transposase n=1 Tax=Streptomyces albireticuli TaxID=1940 RepID=UPI001E5CD85D|nr:transposase [Streptomyces albireticuli]MCD9146098.1 transposase [Streptomyces albireticuli]